MAQRNFLVDLNLNNNYLLNASLQVLASEPTTPTPNLGFIYYNSAVNGGIGDVLVKGSQGWLSLVTLPGNSILLADGVDTTNRSWSAKDLNEWIAVASPGLQTATSTILGGSKLFSDTTQTVAASAVTSTASRTYGVQMNADDQLVVNVPWTNTTYTNGTLTILNTGTSTTTQLWSAKDINDWASGNYYNKTEIDNKLSSIYSVKGSVANFAALPSTGQIEGDVWNTIDTGDNYVWVANLNNTGTAGWDKLGGSVDLSDYVTTSELSGYVPTSRTITLTAGTGVSISTGAQNLSQNRTWTITNTAPNVATNLSYTGTSDTITLNSSDGTNVTVKQGTGIALTATDTEMTVSGVAATTSVMGMMSAADKVKLNALSTTATSYEEAFGAVGVLSYPITHSLGSKFVNVQTYESGSGKQVEMEVTLVNDSSLTVAMNNAPTVANQYVIKVIK